MAGSVNKVILVGNLGADPEVRRTQDGRPIVNLRVATSDTWRDKATGERREKTAGQIPRIPARPQRSRPKEDFACCEEAMGGSKAQGISRRYRTAVE